MINVNDKPNNGDDVKSPNDHDSITGHMVLYDGENFYTVSTTFYELVRHQVVEIIPGLIPGEKYTAEILCGDGFWKALTAGEQKMAGRCVANMVVNRLFPLRFVQTKHEYPKHYELIQH
jgi:hypothetical protein